MTTYLIGIDVGTTGSKAVLLSADGLVRASVTNEYPMYTPFAAWAEQDPADWWKATVASIRGVMAEANVRPADVAGVGLTGQMHGLVALDAQGEVLRRCIMWNDQRTAAQCAAITRQVGAQNLLRLTGNPVLPLGSYKHEPRKYQFYTAPPSELTVILSEDQGKTWRLATTEDFR